MILLATGALPAAAEAGDARAAAAEASLTGNVLGIPVELLDLSLSEVEVAQGDEDETATENLLSINLPIIGPVPLVSAEVVSSTASSNHVRAAASSTLSDVAVSLPVGALPPVLTLDAISSSALCHIVEAPTAEVIPPVSATLLGQPIEIDLDEDIEVDIGIAEAVLRFEEIEITTDSASAIGLVLSLDVNILGLAALDLDLTIATSACERGIAELPSATSLAPASGPETGGTEVCISGEKFVPGYTTVHIGTETVPAAEVEVVDFMTACFTTPPHAPGVVDVTVETPGGVSDPPLDFEYIPVGPGQPTATGIDPDSGPESGGTLVTVTGTDFVVGNTAVHIGPNTVPAAEVNVIDATTLEFTTPPNAPGIVDVTVETPGGESDPPLAFEYLPDGPGQPEATGIDPASGPETGGTLVTITGDNFVDGGTSVHIGSNTVPATEVTVIDPMTLQFTTPAHTPGIVDVTVETPGGVSDPPLAFEYTPVGGDQPVATGIDPASGPETGGTPVTITGDNFVDGDTVVHIGSNTVPATEVDVIDPMTLQFTTPAHAPEVVDVTVETSGGESDPPLAFEYVPVGPGQPVATSLTPDEGPETGGTVVLVSGANFVAGQTSVHIGSNTVPASEVTVINPMTLLFTTPPHAPGVVDVTVETSGGESDPPLAFEYTPGGPGQPVATGIDPDSGPETGGTVVTLTGDNFVDGETSVHIGGNMVPTGEVTVIDSMTLQFTTPPHAPGIVDVTVETPGGVSDPPLVFEYLEEGVDQRLPAALEVDYSNAMSDGNLVFEPGERVEVAPEWLNDGPDPIDLTGTAVDFTGPAGPTYTLVDAGADYGTVNAGATSSCQDTANCYEMEAGPSGIPRPSRHWDTTFEETLSEDTQWTWTLHLGDSFLDVPRSHLFYRFIETIFHHDITVGCTSTEFCPGGANSRAQMAVFVLKSAEGPDYQPLLCTPGAETFDDVPASNIFCSWIEELESRGVVTGCGGNNYCPGDPVTRQQMSVFLLRTLEGADYTPPPCDGLFVDVQCPSQFASWVEDLFLRGITEGCTEVPSAYCPEEPISRGQMSVFLTRTFGLDLYGP